MTLKQKQPENEKNKAKLPAPVKPRVFRIDPNNLNCLTDPITTPQQTRTVRRRVVVVEETVVQGEQPTNKAVEGFELREEDAQKLHEWRTGKGSDGHGGNGMGGGSGFSDRGEFAPSNNNSPQGQPYFYTSPDYRPRQYAGREQEPLIDRMAGVRRALNVRYGFLAALAIGLFLGWGATRLLKQGEREPRKIEEQELAELENAIKPELIEAPIRMELEKIERATNPERMEKYLRAVRSGNGNRLAEAILTKTIEIINENRNSGPLHLTQILDLYDWVRNEIRYVTFLGEEFPRRADSTLEDRMGDSKDKAVLLAAMGLALGARMEIIIGGDRIFNGVRISPADSESGYEETERAVRKLLSRKYGSDERLNSSEIGFATDEEGLWLLIDATNPGDGRFEPISESTIKDVFRLGNENLGMEFR